MSAPNAETELDRFFSGLESYDHVWWKAKESLDVHLARAFSVFDYIQPDENGLSRIIADLLDPGGKHGQGVTFLRAFLDMLRDEGAAVRQDGEFDLSKSQIRCEAATTYISHNLRRIDIRIELSRVFGIGIENKPWAGEQPDQLSDYHLELKKRYGEDGFVLCYLCPQGKNPETLKPREKEALESQGRFRILHYSSHLRKWLDECIREVQADKVRSFLKDFRVYLDRNFPSIPGEEAEKQ